MDPQQLSLIEVAGSAEDAQSRNTPFAVRKPRYSSVSPPRDRSLRAWLRPERRVHPQPGTRRTAAGRLAHIPGHADPRWLSM